MTYYQNKRILLLMRRDISRSCVIEKVKHEIWLTILRATDTPASDQMWVITWPIPGELE